jgi:hypothetical protein
MSMTDRLVTVLAAAMAQLITAIDATSDDEVDPGLASGWFDDVAAAFNQMSDADRQRLAELFRQAAARETRSEVRRAILELPDNFGLEEDA